jgi:hypothetical protein
VRFTLLGTGWHPGRSWPLRVLAPAGFERFTERLTLAWAEERAQRLAFERRPNADGFAPEAEEIRPRERHRFAGIAVEAVAVDHSPVEPTLVFVFNDGRHRRVLSGDTRPCPALVEAARDCASWSTRCSSTTPCARRRAFARPRRSRPWRATTRARARWAGSRPRPARSLVLTHLVPPDADPLALLHEVRLDCAGPILVGEDLMRLDLERGTLEWRGAVLGWGR